MFATLLSLVSGVSLRVWAIVALALAVLILVVSLYVRLERAKAEAAELRAEAVQLKADKEALEGNVATLMADHEAKQNTIRGLEGQVAALNAEHESSMAEQKKRCDLMLRAKYKELKDIKGKVIDEMGSTGAVGAFNELFRLSGVVRRPATH